MALLFAVHNGDVFFVFFWTFLPFWGFFSHVNLHEHENGLT